MHTTKESNIMPKDFYFEVRELQSVRRIYRVEAETLEEATEKAQDGETIDEIGDEIDEVMQRDIHQQIPERQYRDAADAQNNAKRSENK
jgi:methionine aminopeptidase